MKTSEMKAMLSYMGNRVIESKQYLTEIDSLIGDGDHGIGMENGFLAASKALDELAPDADIRTMYMAVGKAMLMSMGGASGAIFGTLFMSIGKAAPEGGECAPADFAAMLRAGLEGIKARGKAQVGDKTMVDALEPAVIAMESTSADGFAAMLDAGDEASQKGVEATKDMIAKFGRAKSLMERAIGYQDAGATSTAIMIKSMGEFVKENGIN